MSDELKPCPFCGSAIVEFKESKYWTGMRSKTLSFTLIHWCNVAKSITEPIVKITGKTIEDTIDKWNTRI